MISNRRRAQVGLILACLTMIAMLTILFRGSYEITTGARGDSKGIAAGEHAAHVKIASMGK